MRKLFLIIILAGLLPGYTLSQNNEIKEFVPRKPFWSLSVDGGVIIPSGKFSNSYKISLNLGFEIAYDPVPNFAVLFTIQYNFLNIKDSNTSLTPGYIELGPGGRVYVGRKNTKFFIEAGMGDYIYHYTLHNGVSGAPLLYSRGNFGLKAGIGGDLAVAKMTTIFLKTDYHTIFTPVNSTNYLGIYAGVRYIF